jgi:fatty acid desaturase
MTLLTLPDMALLPIPKFPQTRLRPVRFHLKECACENQDVPDMFAQVFWGEHCGRVTGGDTMLRIARYGTMNLLMLLWIAAILAGGPWAWAVYVGTILLVTVADEHSGDDVEGFGAGGRAFYDLNLYLTLPIIAVATSLTFALLAPPGGMFDYHGLWSILGFDLAASRAATGPWSVAGMVLLGGLFYGGAGINVSHELMHRTGNLVAWLHSRWLLAFSLDTTFAIEHIHGHHRYVCTERDPASARRGEYVLAFVVRSTRGQFVNAFRVEKARLARRGKPAMSHDNLALRGQLMSVAIAVAAYALAGWPGLGVFLAMAVQGKIYLELVNYVEHYGLVRAPGARVEPRHAWNCYHNISNAVLYNLPRHSNHHMFASKPFWALEADMSAPLLPYGYKTMIVLSLVPSLWKRIVEPRVVHWDEHFASEDERRILAERGQLRLPIAAE